MWFLANCLIFILGQVNSSDVCMSLSDVATVVAELVFNGSSLKASQHTSSDLKPHSGHSWTSVHGWHLSISGLLCRIVSLEIFSENCSFKNKNKKWMGPLWRQLAMKPCAEHFGCCNLAFLKPDIMSRVWIWVGNRSSYHSDLSITRWSHWMVLQILKEGIDFVFLTVFSYVMLKLHFFVLILRYLRDSMRC